MNDITMFERHTQLHLQAEIGMYYCGKRINTVNHEYGPEIRSHYLFVLVDKGNAFMIPDKKITFGEHDLLIMHPGEKIHYRAVDEWSISWLGLYGKTVSEYVELLGVSSEKSIMNIPLYTELKVIMDRIYNLSKETRLSARLSVIGLIHEFFSVLLKCSRYTDKTEPINAALNIIDYNYCTNISVEQIAEYLSIDPAYFSRKFTQKTGISPKRYIIKKRIERAKELLCSASASIFEIANSVGYEDQFYFCKIFKKYTGLSPSEYQKNNAHLY